MPGEPHDGGRVVVAEAVEQPLTLALDHLLPGARREPRLEPRQQRPGDHDESEHGDRAARDALGARHQRRDDGGRRQRRRHGAGRLRDPDEHQPRHAGPRPAGERQQPRIDGAPHVATRSLATRRRNTQYENAW